jgi:hypothetical protein
MHWMFMGEKKPDGYKKVLRRAAMNYLKRPPAKKPPTKIPARKEICQARHNHVYV